jgi:alpha/beta superfamily hydrolase
MPEVMFAGPDGRLEGRYHHSKESGAPVALILHPHPLHGGTMNNRITYSMYQAFQKLGCSVMRFNFRGVGRSQGRYDGVLKYPVVSSSLPRPTTTISASSPPAPAAD